MIIFHLVFGCFWNEVGTQRAVQNLMLFLCLKNKQTNKQKTHLAHPVFLTSLSLPDADEMPEIRPDLQLVLLAGITHRVTSRRLAQTQLFSIRRRSSIWLLSSRRYYSLLGKDNNTVKFATAWRYRSQQNAEPVGRHHLVPLFLSPLPQFVRFGHFQMTYSAALGTRKPFARQWHGAEHTTYDFIIEANWWGESR